jgi:hypothetical protein
LPPPPEAITDAAALTAKVEGERSDMDKEVTEGASDNNHSALESSQERRDILSTPFESALKNAATRTSADVFIALRKLAISRVDPFTGEVANDGALIYQDDDGNHAKVSKDAVRTRLKRWIAKNT